MALLLRQVSQSLIRSPAYATAAVGSLVLGIAVNAIAYGLIDAAAFGTLPYEAPDELYSVQDPRRTGEHHFLSHSEFVAIREESRSFTEVGAYMAGMGSRYALRFDSGDAQLEGYAVTSSVFRLLGVAPLRGRTLMADDERDSAPPVVVVSYAFWQQHLGGANVIGSSLRLGGRTYVVVGVMPAGFWFPSLESAFWVPLSRAELEAVDATRTLSLVGRLDSEVSPELASEELRLLGRRLDGAATEYGAILPRGRWWRLISLDDARRPADLEFFYVMQGVVLCILLIACTNLSNLGMVRALARRRELAIAAALGAPRRHLIKQPLGEVALLIGFALPASALVSYALVRVGTAQLGSIVARNLASTMGINVRILAVTVTASLIALVVSSIGPVLFARNVDVNEVLKEGAHTTSGGPGTRRIRDLLVIGQVALSLCLLAATGVLVGHLMKTRSWDPGFPTRGLHTIELRPDRDAGAGLERILSRVRAVPGVRLAAAASRLAPSAGRVVADNGAAVQGCFCQTVTRDYLRVLGVRPLAGRHFDGSDPDRAGPVIVSEDLALRLWGGRRAVGRQVRLDATGSSEPWRTVVGVVPRLRLSPPVDGSVGLTWPNIIILGKVDSLRTTTLFFRSAPDARIVPAVREALRELDAGRPFHAIRSFESRLDDELGSLRWYTRIVGAFAVVALILSAIGLNGVTASFVANRRREIGVRMALGARRWHILRWTMRRSTATLAIGTGAGACGAYVLTRVIASALFGANEIDAVLIIAGSATLLLLVALAAAYFPARRATWTDPNDVLRMTDG